MKVTCLQENLRKGLSIVGRAVATKTTLPITNNILLAAEESRLKLGATNLEIGINCWVGGKVEEEGAITVPARLLTEFVNSLPSDKVELVASARKKDLQVTCARATAQMKGLDAEDFPPIPSPGPEVTTQVEPEVLRHAISQVAFAAATDELRPVLTGVLLKLAGEEMTLAAADGFRLAVRTAPLASAVAEPLDIVVPARSLAELSHILADALEPVDVAVTPARNQILFSLPRVSADKSGELSVVMVSQLLPGAFPNYAQLIPQSSSTQVEVSTSEFLKATEQAAIFARDSSGIVRLQINAGEEPGAGKMVVSARAEEIGGNQSEIDAVIQGESAKIAFNARYLIEVLKVIAAPSVILGTSSPSSPGVLRPVGDPTYVHVIMPMFVQW